jgi:hypothetical protein
MFVVGRYFYKQGIPTESVYPSDYHFNDEIYSSWQTVKTLLEIFNFTLFCSGLFVLKNSVGVTCLNLHTQDLKRNLRCRLKA